MDNNSVDIESEFIDLREEFKTLKKTIKHTSDVDCQIIAQLRSNIRGFEAQNSELKEKLTLTDYVQSDLEKRLYDVENMVKNLKSMVASTNYLHKAQSNRKIIRTVMNLYKPDCSELFQDLQMQLEEKPYAYVIDKKCSSSELPYYLKEAIFFIINHPNSSNRFLIIENTFSQFNNELFSKIALLLMFMDVRLSAESLKFLKKALIFRKNSEKEMYFKFKSLEKREIPNLSQCFKHPLELDLLLSMDKLISDLLMWSSTNEPDYSQNPFNEKFNTYQVIIYYLIETCDLKSSISKVLIEMHKQNHKEQEESLYCPDPKEISKLKKEFCGYLKKLAEDYSSMLFQGFEFT
jgi:hypothetical protein